MSIQKNKKRLKLSHINPKSGLPICLCYFGIIFTLLILNVNNVYAHDKFAVTCINNRTKNNISYFYKWGNGKWKSVSVKPKSRHWISWTYKPGSYSSPQLKVKFDRDLGRGKDYITYNLKRNRSPKESCENAKRYHFGIDHHGEIRLYEGKKH